MATQAALRDEIAEHLRAINRLNDEIKTIQNFIASDEKNAQHAVEAVRTNAQLSLINYRSSLAQKQSELQDLQQDLQRKQAIILKMEEVTRKQQEVQRLAAERDRVVALHDKSRADLERLEAELDVIAGPRLVPEAALVMADGQRRPLPTHEAELLVGCTDAADGIFPPIDLTPFGGTASGVSRRHATLRLRNGAWTLTDENSTNGTFVDGNRLAPQIPKVLVNGSKLRFGAVEATFAATAAAPANRTVRLS